jgi:SAM-dependent methyltransferase
MRAVEQLLRATARAEARHFWFQGFRRFVVPLVQRATKGLSDGRLLDCGCGTGANLDLLNQFGHAYGFELNPAGLQIGRQMGRPRLARATVAAIPFPDNAFDLVTSFDVLYSLEASVEHQAVDEMYRVTRPGGFLLVNVAAMDVLRGDHSVLSQELRRYSRASLARLLIGAGFTIERLTYTNASLFLPMAAMRTLQRWKGLAEGRRAEQEITVPWAPVNALLAAVLRVESWWLRVGDNPFGSSLLCLARKPA